jgi:hypothetical protein
MPRQGHITRLRCGVTTDEIETRPLKSTLLALCRVQVVMKTVIECYNNVVSVYHYGPEKWLLAALDGR